MDTLITAWLAMGLLILFAFTVTRKLDIVPDGLQSFSEMLMEFIENISTSQIRESGEKHVPLIGSLFLFILIGNLFEQIPWSVFPTPYVEFSPPTSDLNVTVALALIVSIYYFGFGIYKKGLKYFKHYLEPFPFLLPINIIEDFTRPLTLALRLFGNIFAGDLIIMLAILFIPKYLFGNVPILLFELFIDVIQAFIFAILAASYIGVVSEEH